MPMQKDHYPANWKDISRAVREAAGWQCQAEFEMEYLPGVPFRCARKQGDLVKSLNNRGRLYKIVLTVAHLDHNPQNNNPENLRAFCQAHHLEYDRVLHAQHAKETRQKKKEADQLALFGGNKTCN